MAPPGATRLAPRPPPTAMPPHPSATRAFRFDNRFARELPAAGVRTQPVPVAAPRLLYLNQPLAEALGLDLDSLQADDAAEVFAGNRVPQGAEPVAQAYAGHQFGGFSAQLGDGRALLLGEVIDRAGARRDIALKGSGRTAFSRGGDGRAAVGPMLREVLVSEALHALGIPTTRSLAVVATGETVRRERPLPGAVLTRVAASHLRVGTLQYFAARGDRDLLRQVADHAVSRHDPELAALAEPERWVALLAAVARRQARLVAQWMNVGFIHGVMNTDNMTLSGESIDFGPCAFLDAYDPQTVFSSIDHGGRYAYANQPLIARWNLARLAEALLPLMAEGDDEAEVKAAVAQVMPVIDGFPALYEAAWREGLAAKLGLQPADRGGPGEPQGRKVDRASDGLQPAALQALQDDWLAALHQGGVDFTRAFRLLGAAAAGDEAPLRALMPGPALEAWLPRWQAACRQLDGARAADEAGAARRDTLNRINPAVIPRNHRVEAALEAASEAGRLQPFDDLLAALQRPYEDPADPAWLLPAPAEEAAGYQTFCGT